MSTNSETQSGGLDTIKLVVALLVLVAGIWGFYHFSAESLLYRVIGLLAVIGVAIGVVLTTFKGRSLLGFMGASRNEVRKVVWPGRQETVQTTIIVLIFVVILSIFLWFVDMLLSAGVQALLAIGG